MASDNLPVSMQKYPLDLHLDDLKPLLVLVVVTRVVVWDVRSHNILRKCLFYAVNLSPRQHPHWSLCLYLVLFLAFTFPFLFILILLLSNCLFISFPGLHFFSEICDDSFSLFFWISVSALNRVVLFSLFLFISSRVVEFIGIWLVIIVSLTILIKKMVGSLLTVEQRRSWSMWRF